MIDAGSLSPEQAKLLSDATSAERVRLRNLREAARLRLTEKTETVHSYRGDVRNIDLYLKRLKQQGLVSEIYSRGQGIYEARYGDGTSIWFHPEGQPVPGTEKNIYSDEIASEKVRHFDELPQPLRQFAGKSDLRFVAGEGEGAKLLWKDGRAVVRLGARYDAADLRSVVQEAQRLWIDPKADAKAAPRPVEEKDAWQRAKELEQAVEKLRTETAGQPDQAARQTLAQELERQIPDLALLEQVQSGKAKMIITLVLPGGGPTGVKTMNDRLIGYQLNSTQVIPLRNAIFVSVFSHLPFNAKLGESITVVEQTYKSTTMTTTVGDLPRLQRLMNEGLHRVDEQMFPVLKKALVEGREFWSKELNKYAGDKNNEQYKDAKKRVGNITNLLADLERVGPAGFRFDVQFGMAEVRSGDAKTPGQSYQDALEAKMNATKAAIMARSGNAKGLQEAAGGDTRGQAFDEKSFLAYADEATALHTQIIAAGNVLTLGGRPQQIFTSQRGMLLPNPAILRDVRKGKITKEELPEKEQAQLTRITKYIDHINAFDFFKGFVSAETATALPARMRQAQELLDALREGKNVDVKQLRAMLEQTLSGQVIPQMGESSEAVFYNRSRELSDRILINADIIDLGLDGMLSYARTMHEVSAKRLQGGDLFKASNAANDALVKFKRGAYERVRAIYDTYRQKAIAALEKKAGRTPAEDAALAELRKERDALLLLGGDEITLSLHPALEPYLPEIVASVAQACRGRVAVTRAQTTPEQATSETARIEAHRKAMQGADPAANSLKSLEIEQRKLQQMVEQIADASKRLQAKRLVDELELDMFYADVDAKTGEVRLRRFQNGQLATESEVKQRIEDVKAQLHELYGAPLPLLITPGTSRKKEDEEERALRIVPAVRGGPPPRPASFDFASERLELVAPDAAPKVRASALQNLRQLPLEQSNRLLVELPEGCEAVVSWLARPGMDATLRAFNPEFAVELALRLCREAEVRQLLTGLSPETLRYWYQSGYEKQARGSSVWRFIDFLRNMEKYRGSLTLNSAEQGQEAVAAFSKTTSAYEFSPAQESHQTYLESADAPRRQYQNAGDYLLKMGFKDGRFFTAQMGSARWIFQMVDGQLIRGWIFDGGGDTPQKTIDLRAGLENLKKGLAAVHGKSKDEAEAILRPLVAQFEELKYLRQLRDIDLKAALKVLDDFEVALRKK